MSCNMKSLTVKEMIEKLKTMPMDAHVEHPDGPVGVVRLVKDRTVYIDCDYTS